MTDDVVLKPVIKLNLASMNDLVRMAFFNASRNLGLNFIAFEDKKSKKWSVGFLWGVAGYFDYRGIPMFFNVEIDELPEDALFIKYTAKETEVWGFCKATNDPAKWNYLPIIRLAEKPSFF
ncbi:MAG: hypothetical protein ACTSO7_08580 [Candidatus Heimdallarchaeota archaeon]